MTTPSSSPRACGRRWRRPRSPRAEPRAADRAESFRPAPRLARSRDVEVNMGGPAPPGRSDIALLYTARGLRGFGDGFAVIVLPAYMSAIGYGSIDIGIVAAASLAGSAVLTLAVGLIAPRHDLRHLLLLAAGLMVATGLAFPAFEHIVFIAAVAFIGTVNPSAGDSGVFVPLEHAMLARGAPDRERTAVFARYSLIGALSAAAGALGAAIPDILSRAVVYRLAALFSLDSFASGFTVQSLLALWLFQRFDLSLAAAASFFFWSCVLSAFSYPVAARLAKRIGLVNTMVFTHIPSSICLILAAFAPSLTVVVALLLVRSALSQMDVPTRTSYVMAVVTPAERTAAASVTAVPRSLASSLSPALSGVLLATSFSGLPLVICGGLKIVYDLALLLSFRHIKPPEECAAAAGVTRPAPRQ